MPYLGITKEDTPAVHMEVISEVPPSKKSNMTTMEQTQEITTAQDMSTDQTSTLAIPGDAMEGVEVTSRPPTPPTRPDSPSKAECPSRLHSRIPPPNFGAVMDHLIFRSAFPQGRNVEFLDELNIKTMLCFVETEPTAEYGAFVQDNDINRVRVDILANKDGNVKTTVDSICESLLTVLDAANYPLYIHCNQGRHRTGCVIACMRKVQGWPIEAIIHEYNTYANPKMRPGDVEFITNVFQPEALLEYAKTHGNFEHRPSLMALLRSNILDLGQFVQFLSSKDGIASSNTSLRTIETLADSGIDLENAVVDPSMLTIKQTATTPSSIEIRSDVAEVSVTECDPMSPPAATADNQPFFGSLH